MGTEQDKMFARIALHNKFCSEEQLQKVLVLQKSKYPGKSVGRLLLAKRYIDERQYQKMKKAVKKLAAKKAESARAPAAVPEEVHEVEEIHEIEEVHELEEIHEIEEVHDASDHGGQDILYLGPTLNCKLPGKGLKLHEMLKFAKQVGASDLHISVGSRPFVRLHGRVTPLNMPVLTAETSARLIFDAFDEKTNRQLKEDWDVDMCVELPFGRFRTNLLKQRRGFSAVFRVINDSVSTLRELGLPDEVEKLTTFHQGLVLVTGPAGSGKSSTLAALVEVINQNRQDHIITLEDPIEFVFECKQCNVTQREIHKHTQSWGNALRAALREDPDVIMVGEMRDLDTISLAITAAETGHLVLGTLHTTNATRTVDRVLDAFPPKEQAQIRAMVSESLKGIICQQLVPRADGKGRVLAMEIVYWTPAVGNLIRDGETFKLFSVMQTGRRAGMKLMDDSLRELLERGLITDDEARFRANDRSAFS